jgi:dihydroxy-acid dehydratase
MSKTGIGGGLTNYGDRIRLSVANKRIDLLVGDEVLKQRLAAHVPPKAPTRGYAALYCKSVTQAPQGGDFDFLMGER